MTEHKSLSMPLINVQIIQYCKKKHFNCKPESTKFQKMKKIFKKKRKGYVMNSFRTFYICFTGVNDLSF